MTKIFIGDFPSACLDLHQAAACRPNPLREIKAAASELDILILREIGREMWIPSMAQVPVQQRNILIIDDDAAVRNSLKFSLEAEGYRVRAYATPNELLNEPSLPDQSCLIVNYNMPPMNGLEFVARLRDRHVSIPVILATGHLSDNIRQRAATAGVFTIEKPFLGNRLFDCVERAFEQGAKAPG